MEFDQSLFDEILGELAFLDIDEIKSRLQPALLGYRITSPVFDPGAFMYRAKRVTSKFIRKGTSCWYERIDFGEE
jgi:hypothetical protein